MSRHDGTRATRLGAITQCGDDDWRHTPMPRGELRLAISAPSPPELPPGVRSLAQGFTVCPITLHDHRGNLK